MREGSVSLKQRPVRGWLETLEPRTLLTVAMTPQEQLFLELVNRARADPLAEVVRNPYVDTLNQDVAEDRLISTDPKQPLAPHQSLINAMRGHLEDMLNRDYFGHDSPEGNTPSDRALAAGYPVGAGENIAWSGNAVQIDEDAEVYLRHTGLFESVGHRVNMMRPDWREIGPGVKYGRYTQDGIEFKSIMAGTLFGNQRNDTYFITGVAISDRLVANNFYEMGEGVGGIFITAENTQTAETYTVQTGPTGGYSLPVPSGVYNVRATGNGISHPLVVNGVPVDDANKKVDFNTRLMNTRYVQGRFFDDRNGNAVRDAGDLVLANRSTYLDFNNNGLLDVGEPQAISDNTGFFEFTGLLPEAYIVRAVIPDGWQPTNRTSYFVDVSSRNTVGVDFALQVINLPPSAADDQAEVASGNEVSISVLQNDTDPEDALDRQSINIVQQPQHGQAAVVGQQIVYRANHAYAGTDHFSYTVQDQAGQVSNSASVDVQVQSNRPWQNPQIREDVDDDGFVAPRDVLALVRRINAAGSQDLRNLQRPTDAMYYDVSGDGFLSPIDVLFVVTLLNHRASGEPQDEVNPSEARSYETDLAFASMHWGEDED